MLARTTHEKPGPGPLEAGMKGSLITLYTGIHKEIRIELASEEDAADEEQLMISVSVDADDEPAGDLAAAIGAVIDTARAEGREPTKAEIEAAVSAIAGDAKSIDVEVLSTKD